MFFENIEVCEELYNGKSDVIVYRKGSTGHATKLPFLFWLMVIFVYPKCFKSLICLCSPTDQIRLIKLIKGVGEAEGD